MIIILIIAGFIIVPNIPIMGLIMLNKASKAFEPKNKQ
jgi:hypothetical protein